MRLLEYFLENKGRGIDKWVHYFEFYDRHFRKFRGTKMKLLEIGIGAGGSLEMWKNYFGKKSEIIGIDIRPVSPFSNESKIRTYCGDQTDRDFLHEVAEISGPFDIVIDDGGHHMEQQKISFDTLFPYVKTGGFYLCEDTQSSYIPSYGGGLNESGTFMEYVKTLIDKLHAWRPREDSGPRVDWFTRDTKGLHIYDGMVFFEKGIHQKPMSLRMGHFDA